MEEDKEKGKDNKNKTKKLLPVIVCITAVAIAVFVSLSGGNKTNNQIIQESVKDLKNSVKLPAQVDEITTLMDITPQDNAVRYHYTLSTKEDISDITNESIKESLKENICKDTQILDLLKKGIYLEYSYKVENSNQEYFVVFKYTDCL